MHKYGRVCRWNGPGRARRIKNKPQGAWDKEPFPSVSLVARRIRLLYRRRQTCEDRFPEISHLPAPIVRMYRPATGPKGPPALQRPILHVQCTYIYIYIHTAANTK